MAKLNEENNEIYVAGSYMVNCIIYGCCCCVKIEFIMIESICLDFEHHLHF